METLDQDVINFAKATRHEESGDKPIKGKSGEFGYYQYTPDTWNTQSKKYGLNVPIEKATREQQNEVFYKWAKEKKDAGNNLGQISSMHNAGEGEPNAYKGKFEKTTTTHKAGDPSVGVNSFGAKYDVPGYSKRVAEYYKELKGNPQVAQSESKEDLTKDKSKGEKPSVPAYSTPQHSPERISQYKAEQQGYDKQSKDANSISGIAGNTIKNFGDNLTFGGASQLGEQLGTGFAKTTNQVRGLLGGTDNSKYMEDMSFGKTTAGLAKTVGGILATAAPGLKGIMGGSSVLGSAEVLGGVKTGAGISAKIFSKASPIQQYNYLHEALENVGGRVSASGLKAIQNAINELEPIVSKLLPGASKMELGNILKWGAGKVGRGLWNLVKTTATGAGFYELGAGGKHIKGLLGLDNLTN